MTDNRKQLKDFLQMKIVENGNGYNELDTLALITLVMGYYLNIHKNCKASHLGIDIK